MSEINDTVQPGNEMNPELEAMDQRAGPDTSTDSLQTDPETGQDERIPIEGPSDPNDSEAATQTELAEPKPKRRRKKTAPAETQSDAETTAEAARTADDAEEAENTGTAEVELKEPSTYQNAMISYCIFDKVYWRKGIATEALRMFLAEIVEKFGLKSVGAFTYSANESSIKVLLKNGFIDAETFVEDGIESKYFQRIR